MTTAGKKISGKLQIDDEAVPLLFDGKTAVVGISREGTGVIQIVDRIGRTAEYPISVDHLDTEIPRCIDRKVVDGTVILQIYDQKSGMNWNSMEAKNQDGADIQPTKVDSKRNIVEFALEQKPEYIELEDKAGNRAKVLISITKADSAAGDK